MEGATADDPFTLLGTELEFTVLGALDDAKATERVNEAFVADGMDMEGDAGNCVVGDKLPFTAFGAKDGAVDPLTPDCFDSITTIQADLSSMLRVPGETAAAGIAMEGVDGNSVGLSAIELTGANVNDGAAKAFEGATVGTWHTSIEGC